MVQEAQVDDWVSGKKELYAEIWIGGVYVPEKRRKLEEHG